jgi:serine/threonine protein kinase
MRELQPGDKLLEKFEILKILGSGGMGAVYHARQLDLGRDVAIKVPHRDALQIPGFTQRFSREAKTIAKLVHDNVVQVYEFHQSETDLFLVMEYVEGKDLQGLVKNPPPEMKVGDFAKILNLAAQGLSYAHEFGVVHRDIKPHNIMVGRQGGKGRWRVKIMDFGIAHIDQGTQFTEVQQLTVTGQSIGTPSYMSPEQVRGLGVSHLSDIYSFGCVMFYVFSRRTPFVGTGYTIAAAHLGEPAPSMHSFLSNVPEEYDRIVRECLEKDPALRPQDANEIGDRIMRALEPISEISMAEVWATLVRTPAMLVQEDAPGGGDPGSSGTPLNFEPSAAPGGVPKTEMISPQGHSMDASDRPTIYDPQVKAGSPRPDPQTRPKPAAKRPAPAPFGVSPEVASLMVAAQHHDTAKAEDESKAPKKKSMGFFKILVLTASGFVAVAALIGGIAYAVNPTKTSNFFKDTWTKAQNAFYSNVEYDKTVALSRAGSSGEADVWAEGDSAFAVRVSAHSRVSWHAEVTPADIISIVEPTGETFGEADLVLKISPNNGSERLAQVRVISAEGSAEMAIRQKSGCKLGLPESRDIEELEAGGEGKPAPSGTFRVDAGDSCNWTAVADPNTKWLTLTNGPDFSGPSQVTYTATPNPGDVRTGRIIVKDTGGGDKYVTVSQGPGACGYTLVAPTGSYSHISNTYVMNIATTSKRCKWKIQWPEWIARAGEPTGSGGFDVGPQDVYFTVFPNTEKQNRDGKIAILNSDGDVVAEHPIHQSGYFLLKGVSPKATEVTTEMTGSFDIDADAGCEWRVELKAESNWIVLEGEPNGVGPGTVKYRIMELNNRRGGRRFATIDVISLDQKVMTHTVAQARVESGQ